MDPLATWLERAVLHEFTEVYNYYHCVEQERDPAHQNTVGRGRLVTSSSICGS